MIKVLVADDHAVVRAGIKQLLAEAADIESVGEAGSGEEALVKIRASDWDVVLLDIAMPGQGGIQVLRQIKRERPNLPVLIFSVYPEDQYAINLLQAGASGYVAKDSELEQVITAIRKVAHGGKYASPALASQLVSELDKAPDRPAHRVLTEREFLVFCKLARGSTVSEIAASMCLSAKTISTYRARILEKMKMKTNAELTAYAVKNRIIE
jgi:DNA-binding NarL/FixJ family response regulator